MLEDVMSHTLIASSICLVTLFHLTASVTSGSPDTKHDTLTACDGQSVSFSWPCDLQYDLAKSMSLTFSGLSTQDRRVASISGDGVVVVSGDYSDRVRARGTSGVHVDRVSVLDSGLYVTAAQFDNGTVIERRFTLNVHVPPLVSGNTLTVRVVNGTDGCQSVTCGRVIFPGFPSVVFRWNSPRGSERDGATDGVSVISACPLLPGNYSCHLTGPALTCGNSPEMSAVSFVAGRVEKYPAKAGKSAAEERTELILIIVVPILAVMTPLVILGLWVISHLVTDRSPSYNPLTEKSGAKNPSKRLCQVSGGVLTGLTLAGFAATLPTVHVSPGTPSRSVPDAVEVVTSVADGQEVQDTAPELEGEEKEGSETFNDDLANDEADADALTPLMDADSDLHTCQDDAGETRL